MVTDKMLQQAAGEVELAMLNALSVQDVEPHRFSRQFERKMKKLTSRAKHPVRYNVLRSAAAIILIIFTLFGALVAFSPEVRASVVDWIRSTFFEYSQYSGDGELNDAEYEYHFQAIPEGYSELTVIDSDDGRTFIYIHQEGHVLQFAYAHGNTAHNFFVKTDQHSHTVGEVHGNNADIYIAENAEETDAIVWQDKETGVLLCISAKADRELLITLAESVTKTKK